MFFPLTNIANFMPFFIVNCHFFWCIVFNIWETKFIVIIIFNCFHKIIC